MISVIIPVYNRPDEIDDLLSGFLTQDVSSLEIIIVEDGSTSDCAFITDKYASLPLIYKTQVNQGPAIARNTGAKIAKGDFLVFLDSDCLLTAEYILHVQDTVENQFFDFFGGPDLSHPHFSPLQKSISYAMTSFLTTGGIRGSKKSLEHFKPRSFNMIVRKVAFEKVGGFSDLRFGEDIDLSIRLEKSGFRSAYIHQLAVYHKRRNSMHSFFKQVFNSGAARIWLGHLHPGAINWVHALPALFVVYCIFSILLAFLFPVVLIPLLIWSLAIIVHSNYFQKNILLGFLSWITSCVQLFGYGCGFCFAWLKKWSGKKGFAFEKSFYR